MTPDRLDSSPMAVESETWLHRALTPYFFDALRDEPQALSILARELHTLLVASLKRGGVGTNAGLIGIDAGDALQRLPNAIAHRAGSIRLF